MPQRINTSPSLTLKQIQASLQATPKTLQNELNLLPKEALIWRPEPQEWCINECIGHLIECDLNGFAGRIQNILQEERPQLVAWDIAGKVVERRDAERDGLTLLETLATMRRENTQFITSLSPEQFNRVGFHLTVGELSVGDLIFEWIHHDHNHVKQILSNIQAYIWPDLGNAQRFFQADLNPFL